MRYLLRWFWADILHIIRVRKLNVCTYLSQTCAKWQLKMHLILWMTYYGAGCLSNPTNTTHTLTKRKYWLYNFQICWTGIIHILKILGLYINVKYIHKFSSDFCWGFPFWFRGKVKSERVIKWRLINMSAYASHCLTKIDSTSGNMLNWPHPFWKKSVIFLNYISL